MEYEWFSSFDAVPGVTWEPLVPIDRGKLRGLDARPHVEERSLLDDRTYLHVEWLMPTGTELSNESESPAVLHQRKLETDRGLTPRMVAKSISEMLALPGTRSDYHFGMLAAWGSLHGARQRDARAFGWIEALCLADISLMEQGPELVFAEGHWEAMERELPVIPSFQRLSNLYQHEGFLAAAVEIEKRCAALVPRRPADDDRTMIARQAVLIEENGR